MEQNFTTLEDAQRELADTSWLNASTVGSQLPNGTYEFGKVTFEDYSIANDDGTTNDGKYPVIEVRGEKGHGSITGRQIIGTGIVEGDANKVITKSRRETYYLASAPFNPQFTGKPILALLEMQGKTAKVEQHVIKVQTKFPSKGEKWTDKSKEVANAFNSLAPKTVYKIGKLVIQDEAIAS